MLVELQDCEKILNAKADSLFKLFITIISALLGLYCISLKQNILFLTIPFAVPFAIYFVIFVKPKRTNTASNTPNNMLTKKAKLTMNEFYVAESISLQKYAIPHAEKNNSDRASGLKWMLILFFISILLFCLIHRFCI